MPHTITFVSADLVARTATFTVDGGDPITRPIAQEVTSDTLQDHLAALARGLYIEAVNAEEVEAVGEIVPEAVPAEGAFVYTDADAEADQAEIDAAVEAARAAGTIT